VARELDDVNAAPCGRCAVCAGSFVPTEADEALVSEAARFLQRAERPLRPRKQWPAVLGLGTRIAAGDQLAEGRALARWRDGGWGDLVARGRDEGDAFDERLIAAAAELVEARWRPDPAPQWVAAVPSARRPALLADLAVRLGAALGLPVAAPLRVLGEPPPQNGLENSAQQARNALEALLVEPSLVRAGPVLLVDDVVDSRWTLTVAGRLLRAAGCAAVLPLALADASGMAYG
jgi:ATP-dependent DNA helicase RecQ